MNREEKAAVIDRIATQIDEAQAVFAVDYRGISVPQAAELRTKLREADARFQVVKNTLTERAADRVGAEDLKEFLSGPTAFTFVKGDAAMAAKALSDFARASGLLAFKGGFMEGRPLTAADITAISRLPTREVLYGQLVGLVASPVGGLVRTLNALIQGIAIQLGAIRDQGLVSGEAPEEPAAPAPEAAETETAETAEEPAAEAEAPAAEAETAETAEEPAAEAEAPAAEAETADAAEEPAAEAEAPAEDTTSTTDDSDQADAPAAE